MTSTSIQKAAMIQTGENTHHHDQVMTLHHFRIANTAQSNAGHINLNKTLLFMFQIFMLYISIISFVAHSGGWSRSRNSFSTGLNASTNSMLGDSPPSMW